MAETADQPLEHGGSQAGRLPRGSAARIPAVLAEPGLPSAGPARPVPSTGAIDVPLGDFLLPTSNCRQNLE